MATINARNFPDGMLTTAPLTTSGVTPNTVDVQRAYFGLIIDIRVTGTSAVYVIEHMRAVDGVWCSIQAASTTLNVGALSIEIAYPAGQYRVNFSAVTGTVDVGYSCAMPLH